MLAGFKHEKRLEVWAAASGEEELRFIMSYPVLGASGTLGPKLRDGRDDLGCDIMIHGSTCSIGCLAMGDAAAEDLFELAALTGTEFVDVIISPADSRERSLPEDMPDLPSWIDELYAEFKAALQDLRRH